MNCAEATGGIGRITAAKLPRRKHPEPDDIFSPSANGWDSPITPLELPRGSFGGDHWVQYFWTLDDPNFSAITCSEGTTGCPGTYIGPGNGYDLRHSSNQTDDLFEAYFNRPGPRIAFLCEYDGLPVIAEIFDSYATSSALPTGSGNHFASFRSNARARD